MSEDTPKIKDWLFITHADSYNLDSWTYGDWRQYVATRSDGSLQPCRISGLPAVSMMLGCVLMMPIIFALIFYFQGVDPEKLAWGRATGAAIIGFVMTIPWIICWTTPWEVMTAVAPRSYDGMRHF